MNDTSKGICVKKRDEETEEEKEERERSSSFADELEVIYPVSQDRPNAGICWFSAFCKAFVFPESVLSLIQERVGEEARSYLCRSIFEDEEKAKYLRRFLFEKFGFGDDPKQDPLKDGKNAFNEFRTLCKKVGLPIIIAKEGAPLRVNEREKGAEMLVVRASSSFVPPRRLTLTQKGGAKERFGLVSALLGSRHCGHQIGISTLRGNPSRWVMSDADAALKRIGLLFFPILRGKEEGKEEYWKRWESTWSRLLPANISSTKVCNFNTNSGGIISQGQKSAPSSVNSDFIYVSMSRLRR
jgi:hypothetical protein